MLKVNLDYNICSDINFILESEKITVLELSQLTNISRSTLLEISKSGKTIKNVYEKLYSYLYNSKYRINTVKEELLKEKFPNVLFHGSKYGLESISIDGSRKNCDFGNGFYTGETYDHALSFVCEYDNSSVYSFKYSLENLKVKRFDCSLEWMLAICYFRGTIGAYANTKYIKSIVEELDDVDVIIAPIADNKMFYIMAQFAEGKINADVALHSLSASKLGLQYVFRTEKALSKIEPIEKYYVCNLEKELYSDKLIERSMEVDTKMKLVQREYKNGLFIEEILK